MPSFQVRIIGANREAMLDIVRKYRVTVARNTTEQTESGYSIYAHANGSQIRWLEAAGYGVERLEDSGKEGKVRQKEFRNVTGKALLSSEDLLTGIKPHYLSVVEVEKALAVLSSVPYNNFVKPIKLPNKTWENRECNAIKIGKSSVGKRTGIYLLGGIHAREWGSPDILINFIMQLVTAYRNHAGISIGSNKFSAEQIQTLVNSKDIYVFPQANPDGRTYSMTKNAMWRKNRRPAPLPSKVGVDINRNYDFLWDYPTYFAPNAPVVNSKDPGSEVYIGPNLLSEPETKNVVWMFDKFPNIRYFVDIHSYSEAILYNWGDDENQSNDPQMNFNNQIYNGKRGVMGDSAYREYIDSKDKAVSLKLANTLRDAIKNVRGPNVHCRTISRALSYGRCFN